MVLANETISDAALLVGESVKQMLKAASHSPPEQRRKMQALERLSVPGAGNGRCHECSPAIDAAAALDFARPRDR